ncbi:hypothetical protein [Photorhabdus luminescens]|uniref:hypothetical protein n=1 Tax=Photorhabdus luminescens TaxID=29488 RepID=UPI00223EFF5A|nr:hypothetical protein [Photorhabdus luminescens]MCW7763399.1 hypothetical protein [Photorhabdus luminescens subsp. venezuelensis]
MKLEDWITEYEELCESGRAQGMLAKNLLRKIKYEFYKKGLEYNTKNLAMYGSKRALYYIEKGLLED